MWFERALSGLSVVRDLSVTWSCPLHCSPSLVPSFIAGLSLGVLLGGCLGLYFGFWLFTLPRPVAPGSSPAHFPRATAARRRLDGYLHE